ncbi:MAG: hypothetical protein LWW82_00590 [Comamonadaceae bacterium]|nr:hypothetical protein [Comamonadaceae bacterium]
MVAVRRGGAISALRSWLQGIEQSWPSAAIDDPAWRIEHRVAQFVGQGTERQQFAEFFADRRNAHHRGIRNTGVVLADAKDVTALVVMHFAIRADFK